MSNERGTHFVDCPAFRQTNGLFKMNTVIRKAIVDGDGVKPSVETCGTLGLVTITFRAIVESDRNIQRGLFLSLVTRALMVILSNPAFYARVFTPSPVTRAKNLYFLRYLF
jgi:hypothetical protein